MSWSIEGTYFETCSCEFMCPCNFSFDHGATYDNCRVTLVFNIRDGEIEGTDVSGRTVAVIADTPKVMTEGNWRLGMFVDDGTSDEQMEKLTGVFGGTGTFHPVASKLTAAEAKRSKISTFGIEYDGKSGLSSAFSCAA